MLSEFLTMAKSAETLSTKSSIISGKAASLKKAVKKGAKAVGRPFKKIKQSLSIRSTTHSIASRSSTAPPPSDNEADNLDDKSVPDVCDSSEPEIELMPEQELGSCILHDVILITYFRGTQEDLALAYLFILQARYCLSVLRKPALPCLFLCCSQMQVAYRCCPALSGLEGQVIHCQPQATRSPLLWRRCSQRSY
jgi:hypothetical protein